MLPHSPTLELSTTDPEAFGAAATPDHASRLVIRGPGRFEGWRRRSVPDGVTVNEGRVSVATTFHTAVGPRAVFSLRSPETPDAVLNGGRLAPHVLAWWRAGGEVHTQWPASVPWWNLILPLPRFEAASRTLLGAPLLRPRASVHFVPLPPPRHAALLAALDRARSAPPGVRMGDAILRLVVEALGTSPEAPAPAREQASRARRQTVADGLVALADVADGPLSLIEVCGTLGVPLRTLNAASNAVLGLPAAAYLRGRRLNRVHAELRRGTATSVTEAAMRHGFWELGRFAASYRSTFGEPPSRTLGRTRRAA